MSSFIEYIFVAIIQHYQQIGIVLTDKIFYGLFKALGIFKPQWGNKMESEVCFSLKLEDSNHWIIKLFLKMIVLNC